MAELLVPHDFAVPTGDGREAVDEIDLAGYQEGERITERVLSSSGARSRPFFTAAKLKAILLTGDLTLISASAAAAHALSMPEAASLWSRLPLVAGAVVVSLYILEGYDRVVYTRRHSQWLRVLFGLGIAAFILGPVALLLPVIGLTRDFVSWFLALVLPCLLVWRHTGAAILRSRLPRRKVVVVGGGNAARDLLAALESNEGFEVVAVLDDEPSKKGMAVGGHTILGSSDLLDEIASARAADMVAVGIATPMNPRLLMRLVASRCSGLEVLDMPGAFEALTQRLPISHLKLGWVAFSSRFEPDTPHWRMKLKRLLDVVLAGAGLLISAPLLLVIAALTRVASQGPVLFRQQRIGLRGLPFTLLKFRSMVWSEDPEEAAQWAAERDPRITPVGRLLRTTHFDELPQLWNVLRGDMSIVGPRPEQPELVRMLRHRVPYYDLRHMVKPGITGWAQVNYPYGASIADTVRKLEFDLYYLRHYNLFLDMRIILRTAVVALSRRGSR